MNHISASIKDLEAKCPSLAKWGEIVNIRDVIDFLNGLYARHAEMRDYWRDYNRDSLLLTTVLMSHNIRVSVSDVTLTERMRNITSGLMIEAERLIVHEIAATEAWLTSEGYGLPEESAE